MRILWLIFALVPEAGFSADWKPMTGADIAAVLVDRDVVYDAARQRFYASGRTIYDSGSESRGSWQARGDQYCSQWPPAVGWDCYDMQIDADAGMIRFIGESGAVTEARLLARQ